MTIGIVRWSVRVFVVAFVIVLATATWLVSTESGTRWLVNRASPYFPESLSLTAVGGSLLYGIEIDELGWRDQSINLEVRSIRADVNIAAAIRGAVGIDSLVAGPIRLELFERDDGPAADAQPLAFRSPVDIAIGTAVLNGLSIVSGEATRTIDRIEIGGEVEGAIVTLSQLDVASSVIALHASGRVELESPYASELELRWRGVELAGKTFSGELSASGLLTDLAIRHRLSAPLLLDTEGSVAVTDGNWSADLSNSWDEIEWTLPSGQRLQSRGGRLRVAGNTDSYRLDGDASLLALDLPEARILLTGTGSLLGILFDSLSIETGVGNVDASGRFGWSPDLDWEGSLTASDLDPSYVLETASGSLALSGRSEGRITRDGSREITFILESLSGTLNELPVAGSAGLRLSGDTLYVTDAAVTAGSNAVGVSGSIGSVLDLDARVDAGNIGELLAEASGAVRGQARITGDARQPEIDAELVGERLAWKSYGADALDVSVALTGDQALTLQAQSTGIALDERRIETLSANITGRREAHRLELRVAAMDVDASLIASGALEEKQWAGELQSLEIQGALPGHWETDGSSALRLSADAATVGRTCLYRRDTASEACTELTYVADQGLRGALEVIELPLGALPMTLPAGVTADGRIFIDASASVAGDSIDATVTLDLRDSYLSALIDGQTETVRFKTFSAKADVEANQLRSHLDIAIDDDLGTGAFDFGLEDIRRIESPIAGSANVLVNDLSLISILVPAVSDPDGNVEGSLTFTGTLQAPSVLGTLALTDGVFGVPAAGIEVHDVALVLQQREPGTLSLSGGALSGEGKVSISGQSSVNGADGISTEILISGENFELIRIPEWRIEASPDVRIRVAKERIQVTGSLHIPDAEIQIEAIPENARKPSADAVVHGREAPAPGVTQRTSLDLQASLGDEVSLSAFGLTTGLTGGLRVQANPGEPVTGNGRISLKEGRFKAYGQDYEVERGELIFSGPITNPLLDVRAVRRMTTVTAGIRLTGTPEALQSDIFSDPAMSEAETLSYLLTGHGLAQADMGEGDLMNKAAFALGLSQAGIVTSQIRSSLGLETLTVEGGIDDSRIVAGKRIGGRLLVEYGYGLVDQLGTLILKYQLNDRLALESSTGSVSTLDIIYNVRRR